MSKNNLPDVAKETPLEQFAPLNWVGMREIEVPVMLRQNDGVYRIPAKAEAKVSLDKKASRGIHMSRLYLLTQESLGKNEVSLSGVGLATDEFLRTHHELSGRAKLKVHFQAPLVRKALKTENQAWRTYPVTLSCENDHGQKNYFVEVEVTYSSTCPASAALSRQLIQEHFKKNFTADAVRADEVHSWLGSPQGIIATPHAQRSFARVKVEVRPDYDFVDLIDVVEQSLQTAVQGAVKREDEQEFALRNGQNLMFCEDAARRIHSALSKHSEILDFKAELTHVESLHPHNAEAQVSKGLRLGFSD